MPEMDGLAATRALRADPALRDAANHRDDGQRDEGRPRRLSGRRHERLRHEADRPRRARRDAAALAAVAPAERRPGDRADRAGGAHRVVAAAAPAADPALDGIDVAGTLHRLGIDRRRASNGCCCGSPTGRGETVDALRAAVVAGDSARGRARHAHAIAGAAGNLGADALRAAPRRSSRRRARRRTRSGRAPRRRRRASRGRLRVDRDAAPGATAAPADAPGRPSIRAVRRRRARSPARGPRRLRPVAASGAGRPRRRRGLPPGRPTTSRACALVDGYEFDEAEGLPRVSRPACTAATLRRPQRSPRERTVRQPRPDRGRRQGERGRAGPGAARRVQARALRSTAQRRSTPCAGTRPTWCCSTS